MNPIERRNALTFAEIAVTAPWMISILDQSEDNDKAVMLQRNRWTDEGSSVVETLGLEAVARQQRAAYLRARLARLVARLTTWRHRGARPAQA